eukprot:Opistho-1_new@75166
MKGCVILQVFCSGPLATHAVLLGCSQTKAAVIIDAPEGSSSLLREEIGRLGLRVEVLLLTHSHWDHTADVAFLKETLGMPVAIHGEDKGNLERPGSDGLPLLFPIRGVKADRYLEEGEVFSIGNLVVRVIHTPGHSPGSVCFYLEKEKLLIAGDTLFQGTIGNLSFPTARVEKMWTSLEKLAALPGETRVIPGHGPETTIGEESWLKTARERFGY